MSLIIPHLDSYQIIFSSRGSNVTNLGVLAQGIPANINSLSYYLNLNAVLPMDKFVKYSCSFVFKSENFVGMLANNGFVNMNIGRTQIFDGTTQSSNLGIIYPVILNATAGVQSSFYNSNNSDNNPIILYPNQNLVTITLNTFAGVAMAYMPNYVLILNLTPCN
jgi:hypothetical protein